MQGDRARGLRRQVPLPPPGARPAGSPPTPFASLFLAPPCCRAWSSARFVLITVNTLIFGFVTGYPRSFGPSRASASLGRSPTTMALGRRLAGWLCARRVDGRSVRPASRTIIAASLLGIVLRARSIPTWSSPRGFCSSVGFVLIVAIYVLTAVLYWRLYHRAVPDRGASAGPTASATCWAAAPPVVSPFIVLALFQNYGLHGVLGPHDRPC